FIFIFICPLEKCDRTQACCSMSLYHSRE
ncbi:hypothetical protein ISN45_Aa01g031650, partial [Arabidopsis thaliana x Arabidopsis arenosa]